MIRKRWAVAALGAAIAFVLGGGTTLVVAGGNGTVITGQGNALAVVKVVNSFDLQTTSSTSWVNLDGAVRRATSTGTGNLFIARFAAETVCEDSSGCLVRIIVKDLAGSTIDIMNPDDPSAELNFDEFNETSTVEQAHAIERSMSGLAAGTYDFQVQLRTLTGAGFGLAGWHLTLERYT